MTNVEAITMVPPVESVDSPFFGQHNDQQAYRYGRKPFSVQLSDALSEDAYEKGIEYVDDPRETAFVTHAYDQFSYWGESDDPYNMPERITPQLAYFEQLDTEQELWMLHEPETFQFPPLLRDWEEIVRHSVSYAVGRAPVPLDPIQYSGELTDYIQERIKEVTRAGNRRLERLWREHELRRPGELSLKYLIGTNQISTRHINV